MIAHLDLLPSREPVRLSPSQLFSTTRRATVQPRTSQLPSPAPSVQLGHDRTLWLSLQCKLDRTSVVAIMPQHMRSRCFRNCEPSFMINQPAKLMMRYQPEQNRMLLLCTHTGRHSLSNIAFSSGGITRLRHSGFIGNCWMSPPIITFGRQQSNVCFLSLVHTMRPSRARCRASAVDATGDHRSCIAASRPTDMCLSNNTFSLRKRGLHSRCCRAAQVAAPPFL